jgi:hypothetical protein
MQTFVFRSNPSVILQQIAKAPEQVLFALHEGKYKFIGLFRAFTPN